MSIDERISDELARHVADTNITIPSAPEIVTAGRGRLRRRRTVLGCTGALMMLAMLAGVGLLSGGGDEGMELAAGQSTSQDPWLNAPVEIHAVDDGFIGVAYSDPRPNADAAMVQLLESSDGSSWAPIDGSLLTDWGPLNDGWSWPGIGVAVDANTVHLLSGRLDDVAAGSDVEESAIDAAKASLSTSWARFDLDGGTWSVAEQSGLAEFDRDDLSIATVSLAVSGDDVVAELSFYVDQLEAAVRQADIDRDDVCEFNQKAMTTQIRRCGSDEIEDYLLPLSSRSVTESVVLFSNIGEGLFDEEFFVVDSGDHVVRFNGGTYAFDDGVGLTEGLPGTTSSDTEPLFGETTDGLVWIDISGSIDRLVSVAARGDERVALSAPFVNRSGPNRPIRTLWYSGSGELDVAREHTVSAGETVSWIAETYGVEPASIATANPSLDIAEIVVGTTLTIPDPDPTTRNWRSIDLEPIYGTEPMSRVWFSDVYAGSGGYVVTVMRPTSGDRPEIGETRPFTIESDEFVFEGTVPYGPATIETLDGGLVESWFHFEAAHPEQHGSIDLERREVVIEVAESALSDDGAVTFDIDEWFDAVTPEGPVGQVDLLWSPDGVNWSMLDQIDSMPWSLAIDDDGVVMSLYGPRLPALSRIDFPESTD